MAHALSTHLTWTPEAAVAAKDAVLDIAGGPGLDAIYEAIEQRKLDLTSQLLTRSPTDQGADYADLIGKLKGLEELPLIVSGIIENGRRAEQILRDQDDY